MVRNKLFAFLFLIFSQHSFSQGIAGKDRLLRARHVRQDDQSRAGPRPGADHPRQQRQEHQQEAAYTGRVYAFGTTDCSWLRNFDANVDYESARCFPGVGTSLRLDSAGQA